MEKMRKMKPSGVEWIGDIPQEWEVLPHKYVMRKYKNICEHYNGEDIISLTMNGVIIRDLNAGGKMPTTFDGYQYVEPEDLLLCLFDIDVTPRCVGLVKNYGITSPAYSRFKLFSGYFNSYYDYLLRMIDDRKVFIHLSKNLRSSLTENDFGAILTIAPPLVEQQRIAEYLDRKCAEIDSVISKTKATIEQYKALKQSVITQAVTKGIRPDQPMKDSGIEWIGEIPQEWEISKLKYLCQMQAGKNLTSEEITSNGEYPVYGGNGIRGYYNEFNTVGSHLLVGRQGALCGNVHKVEGYFWATEHCVVTLCSKLSYRDYLYYLLIAMNLNQYASNTAAQPGLSVNMIQNVSTCIVPIDEQQEIADYLDRKCAEIDRLIAAKEQLLTELESYKKSVIYEYVTGKKEV